MTLTLQDLIDRSYHQAQKSGFTGVGHTFPELLMLIVSELSEALEEYRAGHSIHEEYFGPDNKPEGIPSELADACIRIFDLCGRYKVDLEAAIVVKLDYNLTRGRLHGNKKI